MQPDLTVYVPGCKGCKHLHPHPDIKHFVINDLVWCTECPLLMALVERDQQHATQH
jgi:hypothetical protein